MSTITISDLHPTGYDLFYDSESFMNDLVDGELGAINGGKWTGWKCAISIAVVTPLCISVIAASVIGFTIGTATNP